MAIHFEFSVKIVNDETAFLHGDLEDKICMECQQGMSDVGRDGCIVLKKCVYGLVQATNQYYGDPDKIGLKENGLVLKAVDGLQD